MSMDERQRSHWTDVSACGRRGGRRGGGAEGEAAGACAYLLVQQSLAHGAGGGRNRREGLGDGLGGLVGHCGRCARWADGVNWARRRVEGDADGRFLASCELVDGRRATGDGR